MARRYNALILDLGDVLFSWSPDRSAVVPPHTLKAILTADTWFDYERGRISQADCYSRLAAEFSLRVDDIALAFKAARESLRPNEEFLALIRELREATRGKLTIIALSNISLPDYEYIATVPGWTSAFDRVFPSAIIGERKPHLGCFRRVLFEMGLDPQTTVFVDDKCDNVLSARSLGMRGIVFDNAPEVFRTLRNLFGDPMQRGWDFLRANAGRLESTTDAGVVFEENFTQLLMYELTNDKSLIATSDRSRTWNFFRGKPLFSDTFPDDMDTTSVALSVLKRDKATVHAVMDEMLKYVDNDGIMQTYFDPKRQRMDPFVCVNVLTLFYQYGRGHELPKTLEWVYEVLLNRAYIGGSRYYMSADCFLYFMSRLLRRVTNPVVQARFRPLFVDRVAERMGVSGDANDLSFRILAGASVGIHMPRDLQLLLDAQLSDGGWGLAWFYQFGSTGVKAGNRGLSTALAVKAIESEQGARPPSPSPSSASKSSVTREIPRWLSSVTSPPSPKRFNFLMPWKRSHAVY